MSYISNQKMNILKLLKVTTSAQHASIEARLPLLDANMSKGVYLSLLQKFFCYYTPLEAQLMQMFPDGPGNFAYATRQKARLLALDLRALGMTAFTIAELPHCRALPEMETVAQAWGSLYVIEGATLGGQIISSHLRENLTLDATSGAAFFTGYGSETGTHWKNFCASLMDYVARHEGSDDVISGAMQTFDTLERWLTSAAPVSTVRPSSAMLTEVEKRTRIVCS